VNAATKRTVIRVGLIALVVGLPALCFLGVLFGYRGDGGTRLSGEVVGPDDKPIAGATVHLSDYPKMPYGSGWVLTDEAGRFTVGRTHAPSNIPLLFIVTKDGYKEFRKEFLSQDWQTFPTKIVLEPDPQAPVPPVPPKP
jgi:hypothetical protein